MKCCRPFGSFLFLLFLSTLGFGQVDTTIRMAEVVVSSRNQTAAVGQNQVRLDSLSILGNNSLQLGQALSQIGGVHIRNYGLGRLATSGIRGGSAVHTAVTWNDIPLQNAMNGQVDFSLFPVHFFDAAFVTFGANASLFGSGAVGGSVQLNSAVEVKAGLRGRVLTEAGSFGQQWHGTEIQVGSKTFTSKSRAFWHRAENDYAYRTFTGERKKLPNAALQQYGVMQQLGWRLNERQRIGLHLWWQEADRELPPSRVQALSEARQADRVWRSLLEWQYTGRSVVWKVKSAWLQDELAYTDPVAKIGSDNTTQNWSTFIQSQWTLGAGQQLDVHTSFQYLQGQSTAFSFFPTQWLSAFQATYLWQSRWRKPLLVRLSVRQEWQDEQRLPFIPQLGWEWQISPRLTTKGTLARHFRLPTFNDRYWTPGGNPDVQAEQGWSESLGMSWSKREGKLSFTTENHLFHHQISDWIIWLPGEGGVWSPENKRKVQSYGLEHSAKLDMTHEKSSMGFHFFYTHTRSVNKRASGPNDESVNKQLIYVPVHQLRLRWQGNYHKWAMNIQQTYTGRVFITQDQSAFIPGFGLTDLQLAYKGSLWGAPWQARLNLYNIWNTDYEWVVNQPLPGRYFKLGIQIELKK